jgi:pimeloyl-ACP methyl ester carboxylesterase
MPQGADRSQFSSHGYRRPALMWLPFCSLFICLQAIAGEAFSPVMCPPLTAHEKNQEVSMNDISKAAYATLDRPEVLMSLFHPRAEWGGSQGRTSAIDMLIPVAREVDIGARFHMVTSTAANILFFHGNGEIVSDYDDLGPVYNGMEINFLAVDYRGYGRSTGKPSVTGMMEDCHVIYKFVRHWLKDNGYTGPFIVMGRSLGSASVVELAARYPTEIDGLIVESGFAYAEPLLRLLGIDARSLGFREEEGFRNVDKIRTYNKPTLIIHAEYDHIIPFSDGQAMYDASGAPRKKLVKISGANHNDIFARGFRQYMDSVREFADALSGPDHY